MASVLGGMIKQKLNISFTKKIGGISDEKKGLVTPPDSPRLKMLLKPQNLTVKKEDTFGKNRDDEDETVIEEEEEKDDDERDDDEKTIAPEDETDDSEDTDK
jgi:hypothetical protein